MPRLFNTVISDAKLFILYKNIWSLGKMFERISSLITGNPVSFPITINIAITDKCNLFCKMCFLKKSRAVKYDRPEILSLDEIREFIVNIGDHKPVIHIGGGEPFMREDLLEIISQIKGKGIKCLVTTNGSLMSNTAIDSLVGLKTDVLIFSLYGPENIHDEITGVAGAYKKSLENLKYVLKNKDKRTRILISSTILPQNLSIFDSFLADLKYLRVDGIKIEQLNFLSRKEHSDAIDSNMKGGFNLCPSVFINEEGFGQKFISDLVHLNKKIRKNFRNVYMKPYLNQVQLQDWYSGLPKRDTSCSFITHSVFINYNGDILPCQFFEDCVLGNIKNDSLEVIWRSKRYQELRKTIRVSHPSICMRCCKN